MHSLCIFCSYTSEATQAGQTLVGTQAERSALQVTKLESTVHMHTLESGRLIPHTGTRRTGM
jgi:hypothetical protein